MTTREFCRKYVRYRLPDGSFTDTVGRIYDLPDYDAFRRMARKLSYQYYQKDPFRYIDPEPFPEVGDFPVYKSDREIAFGMAIRAYTDKWRKKDKK